MISIDLKYAYLALCAAFGVVWSIIFYYSNKQNRKIILRSSLKRAPFGPVVEILFLRDYWTFESVLEVVVFGGIRITLEDLLFAFFFSGMTKGIYENFFRGESFYLDYPQKTFIVSALLGVIVLLIANLTLGLNSIYAMTLGYMTIALSAFFFKFKIDYLFQDLKKASLMGTFVALILFSVYFTSFLFIENTEEILRSWWFLYDSPLGIRVVRVPISEIVWAFGYGFQASAVWK